ncbi:MAG: spore coat biosynthesis protein F [Leptospira sp.]|nr:spore coat biosynthesis protein F [Leptospira sp.]
MNGILSTPKPFGFIQARLGSQRLNGKILKSIPIENGKSLLEHIHSRLIKIIPNERIVFLIPEEDDELALYLSNKNFQFHKGPLEDVRRRYIDAAEKYGAKDIIRLTGDNPFIDITSIELLWEAMFHLCTRYYCLAMAHLPLGMGVECFSYESLVHNIDILNDKRHLEHVSLHIKEDLKKNTVYRLIPPHIEYNNLQYTNEIRMTIDENLDFEVMLDVWRELGETDPYFGANEVIKLYKNNPSLFEKNQPVKQVKFELPKENFIKKRISLSYGDPKIFGSGHFERCKSLSIEMQMNQYEVLCNSYPTENSISPIDGYIIDSRETIHKNFPALSIDDLGPKKNDVTSVYFLPHPDITQSKIKNNKSISFYSSPIIGLFKDIPSKQGQWMIYAGSLNKEQTELIDSFLLNNLNKKWNVKQWIRIGGTPSSSSNEILYFPRLSKFEFYNCLSTSEGFISYFGQSIMESMYLGKKTKLIGISEIHKELGIFFSDLAHIEYLGEINNLKLANEEHPSVNIKINRNAQDVIFEWLNTL